MGKKSAIIGMRHKFGLPLHKIINNQNFKTLCLKQKKEVK